MVSLLDPGGREYGPFFFLRVKATAKAVPVGASIVAKYGAAEVRVAQSRKVPIYLVAVECLSDEEENVYIVAVDALVAGGIAVVPRLHSVKEQRVRIAVYDEVHTYFQSNTNAFTSRLAREVPARKM